MDKSNELIDRVTLDKLKWRSRRGLLENDLFIQSFYNKYENKITYAMADALTCLLNLADADLFDLLLGKKQLPVEIANPSTQQILTLLRNRS